MRCAPVPIRSVTVSIIYNGINEKNVNDNEEGCGMKIGFLDEIV
jgi:hypothetical protein